MINFPRLFICRFVACLVSFAIVQIAPGFAVYQAVAQTRTAPVGTSGNVAGTPIGIQITVPSANTVMAPGSSLGLTSTLLAPNAVPTPNTPSVAVNAAVSPVPLSFRPSALPAAAKSVSVNAAVPASAVLPSNASSALSETASALSAASRNPASEPSAFLKSLRALYDGSVAYKGTLAAPTVAPSVSIIAAAPSALTAVRLSAAKLTETIGSPRDVPTPPSNNEAPQAPRRAKVSIGLALAGAGAAAAWYTSSWAVALAGGLLAPYVAVPALVLSASWIALGTAAGFAAFSVETWKGFPSDLKTSAVSAAVMAFRFWARFGLIFDSVLRGKTADANAPIPVNILKYPVIAWLFVAAGYVMSPVAFVLGAAYRLAGTPFLAAFRGAREVIVGFLPWMGRVFRFIGRFVVRIFPFVGGLIWGAVRAAFFGLAVGAALLAAPIGRDAFETEYKPATVPGWIGYRLTQLAAIAAIIVTGLVGGVIGLLSSPLHVAMAALAMAFRWSGASDSADEFFKLWTKAIRNDIGFTAVIERRFPPAGASVSLGMRVTRVFNGAAISLVSALTLPFVSLATFIRATLAAARGESVRSQDTPNPEEESGVETTIPARPGFLLPAVLGSLGAVAGAAAAYLFLPAVALIAAGAALGAGLGFAASQPQAWSGWYSGVEDESTGSIDQAIGGWFAGGDAFFTALTGQVSPQNRVSRVARAILTVPFTIPSVIAIVASFVYGAIHGAAAKPIAAAWIGFLAAITELLPALRRFVNWLGRVLKDIVPFAFGFLFGTIGGVFKSGWFVASNLFRPVGEIFNREDKIDSPRPSEWQALPALLLGLTLVVPALAAFAGSFVAGMVVGIPVALTHGLALGVRWAGTGDKSEAFFRRWERRSLPNELRKARSVVEIQLGSEGPEMPLWRVYVRSASFVLATIPSTLALLVSGGAAYVRSLADARLAESKPETAKSANEPAPAPAPNAEQEPIGKPPVWLAATLGAVGLAAGLYAGVHVALFSLPMAAGWLAYSAVLAGIPLLGLSAGLAVSQPVLWKRLVPSVGDHAKAGFGRSLGYWSAAGKAVGLTPVYALVGGLLGAVWAVAGAVYGLAAAGTVAAYEGASQVVHEILPFLRSAFETAMKVLRRIIPFGFGLVAGLVSGVLGSAAFGALLLGRPYFKHVVSDDFNYKGALGFLGNVFLKGTALVLGVAFGLVGAAAGVLAALPYALTTSIGFAFRFADIGGPVQKFFDHWTYGALRAEMQRLNQLTDRFEFPAGSAALSDGWIRMANILPATIAAAFAGTIAGVVGYFRSLGVAYKSARSGGPIPEPVMDRDSTRRWDNTWRSAKSTASSFFSWGIAGAVIGVGIMMMTSWAPLGLAGWVLVAALAATGVVGALTLGALIAALALVFWIDGQLR